MRQLAAVATFQEHVPQPLAGSQAGIFLCIQVMQFHSIVAVAVVVVAMMPLNAAASGVPSTHWL